MRLLSKIAVLFFISSISIAWAATGEQIYNQYCAGCHETGTANAPRRVDKEFWKKRLQEVGNMKVITQTVINGKSDMPPKGGCQNCIEDDINSATAYLVSPPSSAKSVADSSLPLEKIKLPEGFNIKIIADGLEGARFITRGDKGTLFVGTKLKTVYALVPNKNGEGIARKITLLNNLDEPNGVAYHKGALYVAEVGRITRYDNIEDHLDNPPKPVVINDKLPNMRWHGYKVINVGPDNLLYVAMGMPCNTCNYRDSNPWLGTISRMQLDGSKMETYAIGIRNSVGFDWHPDTKELWFTDNGQDMLGDDLPPDELNYAPKPHIDFGFPYVYGDNIMAPDYVKQKIDTKSFTPPAWDFPAHVAPLGAGFYTGDKFPKAYQKQLFVALHGSWNRSKKIGYQVVMLTLNEQNNKIIKMEPFAAGWLENETAWGRPVDVFTLPDGSLLITDDLAGVVYQVNYQAKN